MNAGYQQWWFRYGQVALRGGAAGARAAPAARDRSSPTRHRPRRHGGAEGRRADRVHLWIGAALYDQETDTSRRRRPRPARRRAGPAPAGWRCTWFGMESEKDGHLLGRPAPGSSTPTSRSTACRARQLVRRRRSGSRPRARSRPCRSKRRAGRARCPPRSPSARRRCRSSPRPATTSTPTSSDRLDAAYRTLFAGTPGPDLTWIIGDATVRRRPVLALRDDGPLHAPHRTPCWSTGGPGACSTGPTADTGGGARRPGMRSLLTNGPELVPRRRPRVLEQLATRDGHLPALLRQHLEGGEGDRRARPGRHAPARPRRDGARRPTTRAPSRRTPRCRTTSPSTPTSGAPGAGPAFDLIGSFETRSVRDRDTGRITWGERDDADPLRPPGDGPRGVVHRPLNQVAADHRPR